MLAQSHGQRGVNTVVPINISRCQHRTGDLSGSTLCSDVMLGVMCNLKTQIISALKPVAGVFTGKKIPLCYNCYVTVLPSEGETTPICFSINRPRFQ